MIDFRRGSRGDDRWQLREEVLLGEIERSALISLRQTLHRGEVAVGNHEETGKQYTWLAKLLYPYGVNSTQATMEAVADKLMRVWVQEFGPVPEELK